MSSIRKHHAVSSQRMAAGGPAARDWHILGILALICALPATTALFARYAYLDDFAIWSSFAGEHSPWSNRFSREGRILSGLLVYWFGELVGGISGLGWMRFAGLCGTILLSYSIFRYSAPILSSRILAFLAASAAVLNPALFLFPAWAVTFLYPWAAWIAFRAGVILEQRLNERPAGGWRKDVLCGVAIVLLLQVTLFSYQPVAGFYFLPLVLRGGTERAMTRAVAWRASVTFAGFAIAVGAYLGLQSILSGTLITEGAGSERMALSLEPAERLRVIGVAAEYVVLGWAAFLGTPARIAMALPLLLGWWLVVVGRDPLQTLLRSGLLIACFIAAGSALFFSAETYVFWRTLAPLFPLSYLVAAAGWARVPVKWRPPRRLAWTTVSLIVVILMVLTFQRVNRGLVQMCAYEVARFDRWIGENLESFATGVLYEPPPPGISIYDQGPRIGEYGNFWSEWPTHNWGPIPVLLNERFPAPQGASRVRPVQIYALPGHSGYEGGVTPFPLARASDVFGIDYPAADTATLPTVEIPPLGLWLPIHTHFYYSPVFGVAWLPNVVWQDQRTAAVTDGPVQGWHTHFGSFALYPAGTERWFVDSANAGRFLLLGAGPNGWQVERDGEAGILRPLPDGSTRFEVAARPEPFPLQPVNTAD